MRTPYKIVLVPLYILSIITFVVGVVLNYPMLSMVAGYSIWALAFIYAVTSLIFKNGFGALVLFLMAIALFLLIKRNDEIIVGINFLIISAFIIGDFVLETKLDH